MADRSVARGWLPLQLVLAVEPAAELLGVSAVARGDGFVRVYERAGKPRNVPEAWKRKRFGFVSRHMAQALARAEPFWVNGHPTRRHLALVMWAYSPTPGRLRAWAKTVTA